MSLAWLATSFTGLAIHTVRFYTQFSALTIADIPLATDKAVVARASACVCQSYVGHFRMQTAVFCSTYCSSGCQHSLARQQPPSNLFRLQARRSVARTNLVTRPQALSSALALDVGSPSNFQAITNIVSASLLGVGVWWYLKTQVCNILGHKGTSCTSCLHVSDRACCSAEQQRRATSMSQMSRHRCC